MKTISNNYQTDEVEEEVEESDGNRERETNEIDDNNQNHQVEDDEEVTNHQDDTSPILSSKSRPLRVPGAAAILSIIQDHPFP